MRGAGNSAFGCQRTTYAVDATHGRESATATDVVVVIDCSGESLGVEPMSGDI
jgi:hypothetical protein